MLNSITVEHIFDPVFVSRNVPWAWYTYNSLGAMWVSFLILSHLQRKKQTVLWRPFRANQTWIHSAFLQQMMNDPFFLWPEFFRNEVQLRQWMQLRMTKAGGRTNFWADFVSCPGLSGLSYLSNRSHRWRATYCSNAQLVPENWD